MQKLRSLFLLLAVITLLAGCINDTPDEGRSLVMPGDELPSFEVVMNDGKIVSNESLNGKPAVIMLFTTHCEDCRKALPVIQEVYDYQSGAEIVCIARNEGAGVIAEYWSCNSLTLPYSPQEDAIVYHLFATSVVPRLYIVNSSGIVTAEFADYNFPDFTQIINAIRAAEAN